MSELVRSDRNNWEELLGSQPGIGEILNMIEDGFEEPELFDGLDAATWQSVFERYFELCVVFGEEVEEYEGEHSPEHPAEILKNKLDVMMMFLPEMARLMPALAGDFGRDYFRLFSLRERILPARMVEAHLGMRVHEFGEKGGIKSVEELYIRLFGFMIGEDKELKFDQVELALRAFEKSKSRGDMLGIRMRGMIRNIKRIGVSKLNFEQSSMYHLLVLKFGTE